MRSHRRLALVLVMAVLGLGLGMAARPTPVAATPAATGTLTVGVTCDGAIGNFIVALYHDGRLVGRPRPLQCRTDGVAATAFPDLAPDQYTVIEMAPLGADLANYESFWRCDADFRSGTTFSVTLAAGQQAECVFLNHLAHSGTLEVRKQCQGNSTPDRFQITLVDTGRTLNIGCSDQFLLELPPGSYTLMETVAPGTDASAYRTVIWCQNGQTRPASARGARVQDVIVREGVHTVCQVTNTYLRST